MQLKTIRELILGFEKDKYDFLALSMKAGKQHHKMTYSELKDEINALGNIMLKMGIGKGTKVGILSENRIEWAVVYLATACIGAINVPLDIFLKQKDLPSVIDSAELDIIFTSTHCFNKVAEYESEKKTIQKIVCFDMQSSIEECMLRKCKLSIKDDLDFNRVFKICEDIEIEKQVPFSDEKLIYYPFLIELGRKLSDNSSDPYSAIVIQPEDPIAMIYMHGIQFAVLTHGALASNLVAVNSLEMGSQIPGRYMRPGEKILTTLPLHHTFPLMTLLLTPLSCYGESILLEDQYVRNIIQILQETGAQSIATVPLIIEKTYRKLRRNPVPLNHLKRFISGGAPLPMNVMLGLQKMGISVLQGYGLSEYSPVVSSNSLAHNRFGSVGRPLPGVKIKLKDPDNGGNGELLVKGPSMMKGYYRLPEKTRQVIDDDGWLHTGDIVTIDNDGFLTITGRKKHIIINKGGKNINPEEIETILLHSPYIKATAIIPKIDAQKGEYAHALILPSYDKIAEFEKENGIRMSDDDLRAFFLSEVKAVSKQYAFYKSPGSIEIVKDQKSLERKYTAWGERFMFGCHYMALSKVRPESMPIQRDVSINNFVKPFPFDTRKIESFLINQAAALLGTDPSDVDIEESFLEFFSSLDLIKISDRLYKEYAIDLNPVVFFECPNIRRLSLYLTKHYKKELGGLFNTVSIDRPKSKNPHPNPSKPATSLSELKPDIMTGGMRSKNEPVAIIGLSGVFPGSENISDFWWNLHAGRDLISKVPENRWDWRQLLDDSTSQTDVIATKWGGFIEDADKFDSSFFNISPREANVMDPQQRIFLQTVWRTIEDSGYKPSDLSGSSTGVFVGVSTSDYYMRLAQSESQSDAYATTGNAASIVANRISYFFNFHGPSETIDTACSSSLYAIHRGVEAVRNGTCPLVIAGGVNLILDPSISIAFSKAGMLSEDGRCKTFDESANGYVRGEGAGVILMKSLSKAEADGDHIYGIIRESAVNHCGRSNSLMAPNPTAQAQLIETIYRKADIHPASIGYIECHGTGTRLGDPVELQGLQIAFKSLYAHFKEKLPRHPYCGIGSVKTNIGHLESAAGIAAVAKVLMALKYRQLPANLHFHKLNPYAPLQGSPFYIVDKTIPWDVLRDGKGRPYPRRAGISSFGFGGANAHLILEEYRPLQLKKETAIQQTTPELIPISA